MSDEFATALALGFSLLVCLVTTYLLLSPWLRPLLRSHRSSHLPTSPAAHESAAADGEGVPVLS